MRMDSAPKDGLELKLKWKLRKMEMKRNFMMRMIERIIIICEWNQGHRHHWNNWKPGSQMSAFLLFSHFRRNREQNDLIIDCQTLLKMWSHPLIHLQLTFSIFFIFIIIIFFFRKWGYRTLKMRINSLSLSASLFVIGFWSQEWYYLLLLPEQMSLLCSHT